MKIKISLLLLMCLIASKGILAQGTDITGTWTLFEMTWTGGEGVNVTTEDQMLGQGMLTEYSFIPGGKLVIYSNMTGTGNLETVEGTWTFSGDQLTCSLIVKENPKDLIWDIEFIDDVLQMTRAAQDGATFMINSYKRK